jgi:outer membrane receptor protein involved in Fe transport
VYISSFAPDGFGGVYLFPSLADFFGGVPDGFRQAFGSPKTVFGVTGYGVFIQDHLPATTEVSLDAGLRYDFEQLSYGIHQDADNFSPRVGLAYSPSNRWVFRAGFGVFFDRYVLANLNRVIKENGQQGFEQIADGAGAQAVFSQGAGGSLAQPAATLLPSIFRADPNLATSYSEQANLGIQLLLAKNLTAAANYLFVRGVKLSRTRNSNLRPPVVLTAQAEPPEFQVRQHLSARRLGKLGLQRFFADAESPGEGLHAFRELHRLQNYRRRFGLRGATSKSL